MESKFNNSKKAQSLKDQAFPLRWLLRIFWRERESYFLIKYMIKIKI